MRFMLMLHRRESELLAKPPEWIEEVVRFAATLEDELLSRSELEWTEVLDSDDRAVVVGPDGDRRDGWYNEAGKPLRRVWVVRVADRARAEEIAALLAGELDTWIEVRECMPGAQRP